MRRLLVSFALAALLAPVTARAADAPTGLRGEMIANMMDAGSKIQELAGAVPDGKFNWKPSKGVRSAGQVFQHVIASNYMLPQMMGKAAPIPMDELMKMDSQTMEPAKVRQMLKESYEFATATIAGLSDADLEGEMDFFGQKITKRAGLLLLVSHSHEHLGQSIAYARANNITPPWTARA
jgi:uncharacterized damage-inducible protein DinB